MNPGSYNVTLVNLTDDARSAIPDGAKTERRGISNEDMLALLRNFCDIDAVENAIAEPEIRVQVKGQSCRIQAGHKKLIYYDALNRDAPGHILTVEQVVAELDGSASAARTTPHLTQALAGSGIRETRPYVPPPPRGPNRPRLVTMAIVAAALLGTLVYLQLSRPGDETRAGFEPFTGAEADGTRARMAGVFLTGTGPGQHGIVLGATGEVRLFQLRATRAPRQVRATAEPGRLDGRSVFATDQPGGMILISDPDTLVYCHETYKRVR